MEAAVDILGLATALPEQILRQEDCARAVERKLGPGSDAAKLARIVFERAGVETRYTCLGDVTREAVREQFRERFTDTGARMHGFREHAPPLAAEACRRALRCAGLEPHEITHLVVVSSTGFFAPGPDVELIRLLGLPFGLERTVVGFMGCEGALSGLRVALRACAAERTAKVLVACVELGTLHFQPSLAPESLISHALFGDAAAALVLAAGVDPAAALARLGASRSRMEPRLAAPSSWEIGADGFRLVLPNPPPDAVDPKLDDFVATLAGPGAGLGEARFDSWCVHPTDRPALERIQEALGLSRKALATSYGVLRDVGNVVSATLVFALERELARLPAGARGLLLNARPGFALEGVTFVRGGRRLAA